MPVEVPLQYNLFTGEAVDNRTRAQRERDREREQPVQMLMFSQRDIAQTDVNPHPRMDASPGPLKLILEDLRTDEEKEADLLRQAQASTIDLFAVVTPAVIEAEEIEGEKLLIPEAPTPKDARTAALKNLENAIEDITNTLAASPEVLRAQTIWLATALVEAQRAGIDAEVIAGLLQRIREYPTVVPLEAERPPSAGFWQSSPFDGAIQSLLGVPHWEMSW
ncbi:MAG: hypothetical protein JNM70_01220 [Anaerolineae bacterium]|nr:hypothetical protein [Anaerolineae bacterium]